MGYFASFELYIYFPESIGDTQKKIILSKLRSKIKDYNFPLDYEDIPEKFTSNGQTKWYNSTSDMIYLSKEFKNILFVLYVDGESEYDIWKEYYKNGGAQHSQAKIVFDEFDENKLQY